MAEWSHQCKGAGRLLLIPAGEMCDRCGMEPEEEVAAVNGRQAGAPPRPLDEWPAFVAFMREQGWDVNDKRLVTPAWAAWMRRALIGHTSAAALARWRWVDCTPHEGYFERRADGEWVKWSDVSGVAIPDGGQDA